MSVSAPAVSRVQRNLLLGLAALLALAVFLRGAPQPEIPYDLDAATPQGLLALRLWLEEMGYRVTPLSRGPLSSIQGDLLFIFPGQQAYTEDEAATVAAWVEAGGILALIGPVAEDRALRAVFGVGQAADVGLVSYMRQTQPILPARPARWPAPGRVQGLDLSDAPGTVPVVAAEPVAGDLPRVTVALQPVGDGLVWHLDPLHDFTNSKLRNLDQAALVPAILRLTPPVGTTGRGEILIDVYHLDPPAAERAPITNLRDWLYGTRWGAAILIMCALMLAYLALQGIRLGPPLRDESMVRHREAAEYVAAMASLYQRGNRRETVAGHLKRRLKLALGRKMGLSPAEPDVRFVERLGEEAGTAPPPERLAALLARLDQPLDDAQLLQAAQEAAELEA